MPTIAETLHSRPYPGRGVLAARTAGGQRAIVYFLTGRSPASRQREIAVLPDGDVAVRSTAPDQPADALRHYVGAAQRGEVVVVGNGDQVSPIADALAAGADALTAWAPHEYEPDGPIFTPRIWVSTRTAADATLVVGYARRSERPGGGADRVAWALDGPAPGSGVLMTTYDGSAAQVRAARVPEDVTLPDGDLAAVLAHVWDALDPELRVAACVIDPSDFAGSLQIVQ